MACENRSDGKEYVANGWRWYTSIKNGSKDYTIDEVSQNLNWGIFKNKDFIENSKNFSGIIGSAEIKDIPGGYDSNTIWLTFEYKNKKYRISGDINKMKYQKYAASNIDVKV